MTIECRLVLIGILAFAGCASATTQRAGGSALPAGSASAPASESAVATALAAAPASEAEASAGGTATAARTEGVPTVEVAKLADANPVTCRDMLVQGSNQQRTRCMTRNDWKVFDQAQRIWAQDLLLRMQGFKR